MRSPSLRPLILALVILSLGGVAFRLARMPAHQLATPPAEPDKLEWPEQATLTVRPAAVPEPALTYRLLPPVSEQTPGNAAAVYLLAFADGAQVDFHQVEKYLSMPLDQLPRPKAEEYLARYKDALRHLEVAGRRSYCQWQDPLREEGGFETTLWHSRNGRLLARVLALRAQLEIADRRFDAALPRRPARPRRTAAPRPRPAPLAPPRQRSPPAPLDQLSW